MLTRGWLGRLFHRLFHRHKWVFMLEKSPIKEFTANGEVVYDFHAQGLEVMLLVYRCTGCHKHKVVFVINNGKTCSLEIDELEINHFFSQDEENVEDNDDGN